LPQNIPFIEHKHSKFAKSRFLMTPTKNFQQNPLGASKYVEIYAHSKFIEVNFKKVPDENYRQKTMRMLSFFLDIAL
jgi:hypothetical protein